MNIESVTNEYCLFLSSQPIERAVKRFRALKIPTELQKNLPFKDKPKLIGAMKQLPRIAVVKTAKEKRVSEKNIF
jgi:hypothetical protein